VIFSLGAFYLYIYARRVRRSLWLDRAGRLELLGGAFLVAGSCEGCSVQAWRLELLGGAFLVAGSCEGCSVQAWRLELLDRSPSSAGAFLLGAHRSGASRLTSTGAVVCRTSDVCKCAEPRTCADLTTFVKTCAGKCAEMCKPVRLNIRRRVQMCGARADVRSTPQMWGFRHIVAPSTTKVYE
jgi:hypothetical protein